MSRKSKAAEFIGEEYSITVTGRNVLVTDAMKDYALEKISKIEKFSNRIIDIAVIMDVQKLEHRVDVIIKIDHTKIRSSASSTDMYASIDKAADRIQTQLRRYKQRLNEHHAKGLNVVDMSVNVYKAPTEEELISLNEEIQDETDRRLIDQYRPHEVVKKETLPLKILTLDEAIMKMELSQDIFMIYRSEDDRKLKIIYRRSDGHYGIIAPEA
jgi:putative sigma-54 modulation protein